MNPHVTQQRLLQKAFLFDDPEAYTAGVHAAFEALVGPEKPGDAPRGAAATYPPAAAEQSHRP